MREPYGGVEPGLAILRAKDDVNDDFTERFRRGADNGPKRRRNESRFQRWRLLHLRLPGAPPQARVNTAPLALTVLYKAKVGQMCRLFGVSTLKRKSPLVVQEIFRQKKTKGTKSLIHETRQIHEREFESGSNCSLNFSV